MISSRLGRNSARLFGATILVAAFGITNAGAAPPSSWPVMEAMSTDTRVISSHLGLDEESSVSVRAPRQVAEDHSELRISNTGLGALYWGLRHPTRAWKIVLPLQPHDAG